MKKIIALISGTIVLALAGCSTPPTTDKSAARTEANAGDKNLNPPAAGPFLDHLVGKWILTGKIGEKTTTHDVDAGWILNREYLRLHEVSRERKADGTAEYEAIVFIGWDKKSGEYSCLWLDTTSGAGLAGDGIGHGKADGDSIPFVFKPGGSIFHNTFVYAKDNGTWQWIMDGEENGKLDPFARLKLTKKRL